MVATLELRQVVVGDVRSPVLLGGPPDADPAEAVVLVHGNPGAGSDWRDLMTPVSEFVRVVAPDMPGFGSAEMRDDQDYTVAGYARHLEGVIDSLDIERVHLVAHDFGGPWALTYAAKQPRPDRERHADQHRCVLGLPLAPRGPCLAHTRRW